MPYADPEQQQRYHAEYHARNREALRAAARARYAANREQRLAQGRAWAQANPEAAAERKLTWQRRNADRHREANRRVRQRPEARAAHASRQQVRRAAKRGNAGEYVDRLVVLARGLGRCGICLEPVEPADFHVDHVVPLAAGGAHTYANTQPAHPGCNLRKGARVS